MEKTMQGAEIIEQYKEGRRDFSGIKIFMADLGGLDLKNAVFRNCKIDETRFWETDLTGADFSGSVLYFCGFANAVMKNVKFDRCKIEFGNFEGVFAENISMKNANLIYLSLINTNLGQYDFTNSSQFRVITDISQVTGEDIEYGISQFNKALAHAELERKLFLRQRLNVLMEKIKKGPVFLGSGTEKTTYGNNIIIGGYQGFQQLFDDIISYKPDNPYKTKNAYRKDDKK